jgi:hypothetical protein
LEATIDTFKIYIARDNVTKHKVRAKVGDALCIPVEWIAENWWILLFEPLKDEESNDAKYRSRHSIATAQHGFPLPDLSIVPFGHSFV